MSEKEVLFDKYCVECEHFEKNEEDDPCCDCLSQGWNEDSHKPVEFKEKK